MPDNIIICVVGMPGSGKSLLSDELKKLGFAYLRFGQAVLDEVDKRGLEINEDNERKIREEFRSKHGMAAIALLNMKKIQEFLEKSSMVVDGLYSWAEYKLMKKKFGEAMHVIAIYSSPKLRYARLKFRKVDEDKEKRFRSYTEDEAQERDYAEIEFMEKGGPIAMADYTILNTGSREDATRELRRILEKITTGK